MTDEARGPVGLHTFADVFFTLGAMALIALAISAAAFSPRPSVAGLVLEASGHGVTYEGLSASLGGLFADETLHQRLTEARLKNETITVVIRTDGLESAFVLESLLGGLQIRQKRLTGKALDPEP